MTGFADAVQRVLHFLERESPIHISNVMLFNAAANKGDRVGFKTLDDGRKVRTFRSSGEMVDA